MSSNDISKNLKDVNQWTRILYMVLFAVALYVANIVLVVVVLLQAIFAVVTGSPNENLRQLGSSLSNYIYQAVNFLTYSSEEKPFPLGAWPESTVSPLESKAAEKEAASTDEASKEGDVAGDDSSEAAKG